MVKARYPEIEDTVTDMTENEERVQYIESTVSTKKKINKRRVHLVETKGEKDLRQILVKLLNEDLLREVNQLTVAVSIPESRDEIRKTMEILFAEKTEWEVKFFVPKKTPLFNELQGNRKGRKPEAVIIKTNVSTYAETLRNIRAVIDPDEVGVGINTVKLSRDKNVIIETEAGKAELFYKAIATKVKGVEARVTGNSTTVLILDIDASINGKEIEEYIKKETKEYETDVKSLRTARSGTQVATVSMPTRAAETLLRNGDIKIGWTRCRVKAKFDVVRCFNCLKMGHHSDVCKEPRAEKRCLKCAQPGHMVKECTGISYCITCEMAGHRGDSSSCPSFRRLIQQARNTREQEEENLKKGEDGNNEKHEEIQEEEGNEMDVQILGEQALNTNNYD
ncbi:hypothetical protein M8J77_014625 [Diaphorina citri]|nr:hypothetical protein M8J77_014625 [Diaphorina citri]